jgi:hypothetical protein
VFAFEMIFDATPGERLHAYGAQYSLRCDVTTGPKDPTKVTKKGPAKVSTKGAPKDSRKGTAKDSTKDSKKATTKDPPKDPHAQERTHIPKILKRALSQNQPSSQITKSARTRTASDVAGSGVAEDSRMEIWEGWGGGDNGRDEPLVPSLPPGFEEPLAQNPRPVVLNPPPLVPNPSPLVLNLPLLVPNPPPLVPNPPPGRAYPLDGCVWKGMMWHQASDALKRLCPTEVRLPKP